ncbi:MAG TPA: hypothetical protein VG871_01365 [Vicinamibacterales bacterium]|nr:hypothetical protein [Vicinamibacterales bacterium]
MVVFTASGASAQNLFEVQVFPDENLSRGETSIELHDVLIPSGTRLPGDALDPSSHLHLSFEVSHGWSDVFETGVFVETAPSGGDDHAGRSNTSTRCRSSTTSCFRRSTCGRRAAGTSTSASAAA